MITKQTKTSSLNRGVRNFNPANIRHSSSKWKGLSVVQPDKDFCTFISYAYGIRALIITLRTYVIKHHIEDIDGIISRYAPATENNTDRYIKYVKDYLQPHGIGAFLVSSDFNKTILSSCHAVYHVCQAICFMESGFYLTKTEFLNAVAIL